MGRWRGGGSEMGDRKEESKRTQRREDGRKE